VYLFSRDITDVADPEAPVLVASSAPRRANTVGVNVRVRLATRLEGIAAPHSASPHTRFAARHDAQQLPVLRRRVLRILGVEHVAEQHPQRVTIGLEAHRSEAMPFVAITRQCRLQDLHLCRAEIREYF